ncbi:MAG: 23S rRNA (uracil(1939)-C(5))-methyltransferase RlmD [Oscillospiraceae bacterium]
MPFYKNQIITLKILSLSSDGSGVGKYDGQAVFVPFTAPGDELLVKIVKPCQTYAFGIIEKILNKSKARVEPDCAFFGKCGGCALRHISYESELIEKRGFVYDSMLRLGGIEAPVSNTIPSPDLNRYRNKVQLPVFTDDDGKVKTGFFAGRSHRVIPCDDCLLQPLIFTQILSAVCALLTQYHISCYNELRGTGLMRHIYLRHAVSTNKVMVCFVINGKALPHSDKIVKALVADFPEISTIVINVNTKITNVITGSECITLYGSGVLEDTLCDVPVSLSPLSFYQVNTLGAQQLYAVAALFANVQKNETLLDLYCGAGTIGLSMAKDCKQLIGVEIVPDAIRSAIKNAEIMGMSHAKLICADASNAAAELFQDGIRPDVVIMDPPRKGSDVATMDAVVSMAPSRIVMVSCNAATAARDCKYLSQQGYTPTAIQPVDMFPRTKHVECVVLMSRIDK